jgi:hypothetical protein
MNNHPSITSHHLKFISECAPYLLVVQPDQPPTNSALGSKLSQVVGQPIDYLASTPVDLAEFDELVWNPSFSTPEHSSDYQVALNVFYYKREQMVREYEDMSYCDCEACAGAYCSSTCSWAAQYESFKEKYPSLHQAWLKAYEDHDPHSGLRYYVLNYPDMGLSRLASIIYKTIPLTTRQKREQHKAFIKLKATTQGIVTSPSITNEHLTKDQIKQIVLPQAVPSTILLTGGYQLCNDCGTVLGNGEQSRVFLDWKAWLRRYVHLICRVEAKRHEPLGIVSKSGDVFGTKLTTLDVESENEDGNEDVALKGEVEARAGQCYERTMNECYDRSLQEVLDKRQSELVPERVYSVDTLTGKRKRGITCFFDGKPIEGRKGTKFCVGGRCRANYHEAWEENKKRKP